MNAAPHAEPLGLRRLPAALVIAASLFLLAGCNRIRPTNMTPLDSAGMHSDSIEQLQKYQINDGEIQQVLIAGRAGMSEKGCVELISLARERHGVFAEGDAVAGLLSAGMKESSALALVRLNQLMPFAGEAEALRLAGISDDVILDVAEHRAKGHTVLAGARLAELRDAGFSNAQLVAALDRGMSDKQADQAIARHNDAIGGHSFVRQYGRRR
jgi:hypothetical protein